jgi:hypothetical protein
MGVIARVLRDVAAVLIVVIVVGSLISIVGSPWSGEACFAISNLTIR